ncbi:MAG: hypothetical protein KAS86_01440 [Candidatus Omnitrophica bacterium]|nr:hypothetical protein [Candidatus Omnitrophota bacterium]
MKIYKCVLICFLLALFPVSVIHAAAGEKGAAHKKKRYVKSKYGLRALIQLSKDRKAMAADLKRETKNYDRARKAIEKAALKAGDTASYVKKHAGEPAVILCDRDSGTAEWVYKPGSSTYFSRDKVYLNFGPDGELLGWMVPDE